MSEYYIFVTCTVSGLRALSFAARYAILHYVDVNGNTGRNMDGIGYIDPVGPEVAEAEAGHPGAPDIIKEHCRAAGINWDQLSEIDKGQILRALAIDTQLVEGDGIGAGVHMGTLNLEVMLSNNTNNPLSPENLRKQVAAAHLTENCPPRPGWRTRQEEEEEAIGWSPQTETLMERQSEEMQQLVFGLGLALTGVVEEVAKTDYQTLFAPACAAMDMGHVRRMRSQGWSLPSMS